MLTHDQCPIHVYRIEFSDLFLQVKSKLFDTVDSSTYLTELLCSLDSNICKSPTTCLPHNRLLQAAFS